MSTHTHTFTTNKETPTKQCTRPRTHTRTYRRPDDCTSSFTSPTQAPKSVSNYLARVGSSRKSRAASVFWGRCRDFSHFSIFGKQKPSGLASFSLLPRQLGLGGCGVEGSVKLEPKNLLGRTAWESGQGSLSPEYEPFQLPPKH